MDMTMTVITIIITTMIMIIMRSTMMAGNIMVAKEAITTDPGIKKCVTNAGNPSVCHIPLVCHSANSLA
jgi:hypothetical protein